MRSGEVMAQEEQIEDISTGKTKFFFNIKAPLYDDEGAIIGILGSAMDITAQKEAEKLKMENELHRAIALEHDKFRGLVAQVNHDIRSPLLSLKMINESCKDILPERERTLYRRAIEEVMEIANNMLQEFKYKGNKHAQLILINLELAEIISAKKREHHSSGIKINFYTNKKIDFIFVNIDNTEFKSMVSNIINNSVDALKHKKSGSIDITIDLINDKVKINITDNGIGMTDVVKQKILDKMKISANKDDGHGIGFTQINQTISKYNGSLNIESAAGTGTTVIITLPIANKPTWIAESLTVYADDLIVVIDDDPLIHDIWDSRFQEIIPNKSLNHFKSGHEAIEFLNHSPALNKDRVLLLADYELLNQNINGIDIINRTNIKRSILVTGHRNNQNIINAVTANHARLLPKSLVLETNIKIVN
jgi:signal transduction histidine kinase